MQQTRCMPSQKMPLPQEASSGTWEQAARASLQESARSCAVLGCGAVGLATALQELPASFHW